MTLEEDSSKQSSPPVVGLNNLGNTCFFNSSLQLLLACEPLTHAIREGKAPNIAKGPIGFALQQAILQTQGCGKICPRTTYNPQPLLSAVQRHAPQFKGRVQHDSHELMRMVLDGLQTEEKKIFDLARRRSSSEIALSPRRVELEFPLPEEPLVDTIFGGILTSHLVCNACGHESVVPEPMLDLSLSIPLDDNSASRKDEGNSDISYSTFTARDKKKADAKKSKAARSAEFKAEVEGKTGKEEREVKNKDKKTEVEVQDGGGGGSKAVVAGSKQQKVTAKQKKALAKEEKQKAIAAKRQQHKQQHGLESADSAHGSGQGEPGDSSNEQDQECLAVSPSSDEPLLRGGDERDGCIDLRAEVGSVALAAATTAGLSVSGDGSVLSPTKAAKHAGLDEGEVELSNERDQERLALFRSGDEPMLRGGEERDGCKDSCAEVGGVAESPSTTAGLNACDGSVVQSPSKVAKLAALPESEVESSSESGHKCLALSTRSDESLPRGGKEQDDCIDPRAEVCGVALVSTIIAGSNVCEGTLVDSTMNALKQAGLDETYRESEIRGVAGSKGCVDDLVQTVSIAAIDAGMKKLESTTVSTPVARANLAGNNVPVESSVHLQTGAAKISDSFDCADEHIAESTAVTGAGIKGSDFSVDSLVRPASKAVQCAVVHESEMTRVDDCVVSASVTALNTTESGVHMAGRGCASGSPRVSIQEQRGYDMAIESASLICWRRDSGSSIEHLPISDLQDRDIVQGVSDKRAIMQHNNGITGTGTIITSSPIYLSESSSSGKSAEHLKLSGCSNESDETSCIAIDSSPICFPVSLSLEKSDECFKISGSTDKSEVIDCIVIQSSPISSHISSASESSNECLKISGGTDKSEVTDCLVIQSSPISLPISSASEKSAECVNISGTTSESDSKDCISIQSSISCLPVSSSSEKSAESLNLSGEANRSDEAPAPSHQLPSSAVLAVRVPHPLPIDLTAENDGSNERSEGRNKKESDRKMKALTIDLTADNEDSRGSLKYSTCRTGGEVTQVSQKTALCMESEDRSTYASSQPGDEVARTSGIDVDFDSDGSSPISDGRVNGKVAQSSVIDVTGDSDDSSHSSEPGIKRLDGTARQGHQKTFGFSVDPLPSVGTWDMLGTAERASATGGIKAVRSFSMLSELLSKSGSEATSASSPTETVASLSREVDLSTGGVIAVSVTSEDKIGSLSSQIRSDLAAAGLSAARASTVTAVSAKAIEAARVDDSSTALLRQYDPSTPHVMACLAHFFAPETVTWECPKEKGDSRRSSDAAAQALSPACSPLRKQVSFADDSTRKVILIPGNEELRGVDVDEALRGRVPFRRTARSKDGTSATVYAQLESYGVDTLSVRFDSGLSGSSPSGTSGSFSDTSGYLRAEPLLQVDVSRAWVCNISADRSCRMHAAVSAVMGCVADAYHHCGPSRLKELFQAGITLEEVGEGAKREWRVRGKCRGRDWVYPSHTNFSSSDDDEVLVSGVVVDGGLENFGKGMTECEKESGHGNSGAGAQYLRSEGSEGSRPRYAAEAGDEGRGGHYIESRGVGASAMGHSVEVVSMPPNMGELKGSEDGLSGTGHTDAESSDERRRVQFVECRGVGGGGTVVNAEGLENTASVTWRSVSIASAVASFGSTLDLYAADESISQTLTIDAATRNSAISIPATPAISKTPGTLEASETPAARETPAAAAAEAEAPATPMTPGTLEASETPAAPETPAAAATPESSETPATPAAPETPEILATQETSETLSQGLTETASAFLMTSPLVNSVSSLAPTEYISLKLDTSVSPMLSSNATQGTSPQQVLPAACARVSLPQSTTLSYPNSLFETELSPSAPQADATLMLPSMSAQGGASPTVALAASAQSTAVSTSVSPLFNHISSEVSPGKPALHALQATKEPALSSIQQFSSTSVVPSASAQQPSPQSSGSSINSTSATVSASVDFMPSASKATDVPALSSLPSPRASCQPILPLAPPELQPFQSLDLPANATSATAASHSDLEPSATVASEVPMYAPPTPLPSASAPIPSPQSSTNPLPHSSSITSPPSPPAPVFPTASAPSPSPQSSTSPLPHSTSSSSSQGAPALSFPSASSPIPFPEPSTGTLPSSNSISSPQSSQGAPAPSFPSASAPIPFPEPSTSTLPRSSSITSPSSSRGLTIPVPVARSPSGTLLFPCSSPRLAAGGVRMTPRVFERPAKKAYKLAKAPQVLLLHLKRFMQDSHGRFTKITHHVAFDFELDMSPFMSEKAATQASLSQRSTSGNGTSQSAGEDLATEAQGAGQGILRPSIQPVYDLVGIVEHSGTMRCGHYVAYVRRKVSDKKVDGQPRDKTSISNGQAGEKKEVDFDVQGGERKGRCLDAQAGERKACHGDAQATDIDATQPCKLAVHKHEAKHVPASREGKSNGTRSPEYEWYCVSDTHVRKVSVKEVASAQAYLLMYVHKST